MPFLKELKSLKWQNFVMLLIAGCINAVGLKTIDFIVEGFDRSKEVMIITIKPEEISEELMAAFECGTTKIAATGGYSGNDKTIIYFVVNRFQIARMRSIIKSIDPKAFVTISEVADVFKANS